MHFGNDRDNYQPRFKMKNIDSSKIMYRSDELLSAAPNRYRMVVQVANRAKRRHYEQSDSYYSDSYIKPVCQAIVEMADKVEQADLIVEDVSISDRQISTESLVRPTAAIHKAEKNLSASSFKTTPATDKYGLFFLKNLANPQAWNAMVSWINSSIYQINLEAAVVSVQRLIDKHPSKTPRQLAEIIFLHKSAQVAGVDVLTLRRPRRTGIPGSVTRRNPTELPQPS